MPRLVIFEPIVSAGGVERFLHGLIGGAIEAGITDDWEIVLVRNRFNSANIHVPWPQHLLTPKVRVQYMDAENSLWRALNRLASAKKVLGIPGTGLLQRKVAGAFRSIGPARWRAHCGDTRCWIENYVVKDHFDLAYFSFPLFWDPPQLKIPMVATHHDFTFKHGLSASPAQQRRLDAELPKWLDACALVSVPSHFVAEDLKLFYPTWAHKARVIRLGIPSPEREPTTEEIETFRIRNGLPECFVLAVGWLAEHKNQLVVFEAIAKLRDRGMRIPVVCVGPNSSVLNQSYTPKIGNSQSQDYPMRILEFCESAGLKNGIDYYSLGYVDDFTIACLNGCALMLIASAITEATSLNAREAMRAGCPVAYMRTPPYEEEMELIEGNAWMFPTHDSEALASIIAEVANNGEEARRRATSAKEIVSRIFSWKETARAYFSLFEEVAHFEKTMGVSDVYSERR